MDEQNKHLLEENLALAKENNQMLKKVLRSQKRGEIMKVIYWLLIIGIALGAFYFVQPYLENVISIYTNTAGVLEGINGDVPDAENFSEFFKQIQNPKQ
jgi:hypothetical protein